MSVAFQKYSQQIDQMLLKSLLSISSPWQVYWYVSFIFVTISYFNPEITPSKSTYKSQVNIYVQSLMHYF